MAFELAYDLDEALKRQNISLKDIEALRNANVPHTPKDITDKQVKENYYNFNVINLIFSFIVSIIFRCMWKY